MPPSTFFVCKFIKTLRFVLILEWLLEIEVVVPRAQISQHLDINLVEIVN